MAWASERKGQADKHVVRTAPLTSGRSLRFSDVKLWVVGVWSLAPAHGATGTAQAVARRHFGQFDDGDEAAWRRRLCGGRRHGLVPQALQEPIERFDIRRPLYGAHPHHAVDGGGGASAAGGTGPRHPDLR
jgi:hypothetical protein